MVGKRFSLNNKVRIRMSVATINLNSDAKKIGKLDTINFPATTELPTIAIANVICK